MDSEKRIYKCSMCSATLRDANLNSVCWASKQNKWQVLTTHIWVEMTT